jgi:futalosine hydrolase
VRALVITAVAAERDAVTAAGFAAAPDLPYGAVTDGSVVVAAGGVGPVAAAVATTRLIAAVSPEIVISAGLAGGFAGKAGIGNVVVATSALFGDLGAAAEEGFLHVTDLGFPGGQPLECAAAGEVAARLAPLGAVAGPILTLATMTGTEARAAALAAAHPDAVAEAMEGYGVAWAAAEHGLPWAEVRAVSNRIGKRDRSQWDFPAAFAALGKALALVTGAAPGRAAT